MDQNKVNPFPENPTSSTGDNPMPQSSQPSVPVNPYAPAGAPYAPGSNTPPPDYAMPYTPSSVDSAAFDAPAVPNTAGGPGPYTSISPAPGQYASGQYAAAGPEKPKFFTKKFIILASVGIVLIIATIVTGVILQNDRNNGTANTQNNSNGQTSTSNTFNSYMNYILTGSPSNSEYSERYDPKKIYYIETVIHASSDFDISNVKQLIANWNGAYNSLDDAQKTNVAVRNYKALVDFFGIYSQTPPLSNDALLNAFVNSRGEDYLASYYSGYTNSDSSYAKKYGKILIDYGKAAFNKYNIYSREGCLSKGVLDEECMSIKTLTEEDSNVNLEYNQLAYLLEVTLSDYISSLITDVWDVNRAVNGEEQV